MFALVFAGCGAMISDTRTRDGVFFLGIALTFGCVAAVMIYLLSNDPRELEISLNLLANWLVTTGMLVRHSTEQRQALDLPNAAHPELG
jgi:hypothetical protein